MTKAQVHLPCRATDPKGKAFTFTLIREVSVPDSSTELTIQHKERPGGKAIDPPISLRANSPVWSEGRGSLVYELDELDLSDDDQLKTLDELSYVEGGKWHVEIDRQSLYFATHTNRVKPPLKRFGFDVDSEWAKGQ